MILLSLSLGGEQQLDRWWLRPQGKCLRLGQVKIQQTTKCSQLILIHHHFQYCQRNDHHNDDHHHPGLRAVLARSRITSENPSSLNFAVSARGFLSPKLIHHHYTFTDMNISAQDTKFTHTFVLGLVLTQSTWSTMMKKQAWYHT